MIIGFVFFVGFVLFLFMYLSPWSNSSLSTSALDRLHDSFMENVETPLSTVFVKANYPAAGPSCYFIDLSDIDSLEYSGTESYLTRLGGIGIPSDIQGSHLEFDKDDDFFRIAISPEFDEGSNIGCAPLTDFELGKIVESEVVSYSKLIAMKSKYIDDYNGLRDDLNIANIFDFAITSEGFPEVDMMPESGISDSVEVLAKDYLVRVLKSDGSLSNERINIRIW